MWTVAIQFTYKIKVITCNNATNICNICNPYPFNSHTGVITCIKYDIWAPIYLTCNVSFIGNSVFTVCVLNRQAMEKYMPAGQPPEMPIPGRGRLPEADFGGEAARNAHYFLANSHYPGFKVMLTPAYMRTGILVRDIEHELIQNTPFSIFVPRNLDYMQQNLVTDKFLYTPFANENWVKNAFNRKWIVTALSVNNGWIFNVDSLLFLLFLL